MRNCRDREPAASTAMVMTSPTRKCSCSASWREMSIDGSSGAAGAAAMHTPSAIREAAVSAHARTRFTPGIDRLLDKLPRPAIRRNSMRRALLVMLLAAGAATWVAAQGDKLDFAMLGRIRDEG